MQKVCKKSAEKHTKGKRSNVEGGSCIPLKPPSNPFFLLRRTRRRGIRVVAPLPSLETHPPHQSLVDDEWRKSTQRRRAPSLSQVYDLVICGTQINATLIPRNDTSSSSSTCSQGNTSPTSSFTGGSESSESELRGEKSLLSVLTSVAPGTRCRTSRSLRRKDVCSSGWSHSVSEEVHRLYPFSSPE